MLVHFSQLSDDQAKLRHEGLSELLAMITKVRQYIRYMGRYNSVYLGQ